MYKVLALDLDGTVLNDEHRIHPEVKAAISQAAKQCHVVIATGRHHTTAKAYYHELGLTTPIICCNGSYIYDYQKKQLLAHHSLDKRKAIEFIRLVNEYDVKMVMYVDEAMAYSKIKPVNYIGWLQDWAQTLPANLKPNFEAVASFEQRAQTANTIWKFVVEADAKDIDNLVRHPLIANHFTAERSWSNRIDFAAKGNTKGSRLAQYTKQLGIKPEEVIAVGDNYNDISMLEFAGLGVAMHNATDTVKQHANAICETDSNHNGLARLIEAKIAG